MGIEEHAVKLSDIQAYIERLAPAAMQESYDNSGLILGDPDAEVSSVLVCLDPDRNALETATGQGCQLVLSHHPAVFSAMKVFHTDSREGDLLIRAVKQDIALYSAHTNFDSAFGGLTDLLCGHLGIHDIKSLKKSPESSVECGSGRFGAVDPVSGEDFIRRIKERLSLDFVRIVGQVPETVLKAAVYNGSYDRDILPELNAVRPDVLITGDLKYHDAQELLFDGIFTVDAGHFGTEKLFVEKMVALLEREFPSLKVFRHLGTDVFTIA